MILFTPVSAPRSYWRLLQVHEGALHKISAGHCQERQFYLFDHLLIYCKRTVLGHLVLKGRIPTASLQASGLRLDAAALPACSLKPAVSRAGDTLFRVNVSCLFFLGFRQCAGRTAPPVVFALSLASSHLANRRPFADTPFLLVHVPGPGDDAP